LQGAERQDNLDRGKLRTFIVYANLERSF
jgi:hypothetical protein